MADMIFDRPVSQAMGAGLRVPAAAFGNDPATRMGVGSLQPTGADALVSGRAVPANAPEALGTLDAVAGGAQAQLESLFSGPTLGTPRGADTRPPATAYFNQATNEMFVGDRAFKADDVGTALQAVQAAPNTVRPTGSGWVALPEGALGDYISAFGERRGKLELLGRGAMDIAQGTIGGAGAIAEYFGSTTAGPALRGFAADIFGQSENEQLRDQLIYENSSLIEKLIDGTFRAAPSIGLTVASGGAAGAAAKALGAAGSVGRVATAGAALSSFPLHMDSFYTAAERNGYDTRDPDIQNQILAGAFANTMLDAFGVGAATGRLMSGAVRRTAEEAGQVAARSAMRNALTGARNTAMAEGLTEGMQTFLEKSLFDPTIRDQYAASDWKALIPSLLKVAGSEDVLMSGAIGSILGGGVGAFVDFRATPGTPTEPVDNKKPVDLNVTATKQAASKQGARPMQGPMPLGEMQGPMPYVPPAIAFDPSARTTGVIPVAPEPGQVMEFPANATGPNVRPLTPQQMALMRRKAGPLQPEDRVAGNVTTPSGERTVTLEGEVLPPETLAMAPGATRMRALPAPEEVVAPPALPPPVEGEPNFYAGPQGVSPADMAAAEPTVEAAPVATPAERLRVGMAPRPQLLSGQTTDTAIGNQLRAAIEARRAAEAQAVANQQATAEAARQAQIAEQQRAAQIEDAYAQRAAQADIARMDTALALQNLYVDADTAWESFRPQDGKKQSGVLLRDLTPVAQREWMAAVQQGAQSEALYKQLRSRRQVGKPTPIVDVPTLVAPPAAAPKATPKATPKPKALTKKQRAVVKRVQALTPEQQSALLAELGVDPQGLAELVRTNPDAVNAAIDSVTTPPTEPTPPAPTTPPGKGKVQRQGAVKAAAPKQGTVQRGKPQPRAEAVPEVIGARTGGVEATAAANAVKALDLVEGGTRAKTVRLSPEEIAARREAERTAPTAAQTREVITREDAVRRAEAEAARAAESEQDLSATMVADVNDLIADVQQAVADGDNFARDTALFELRRMSSQRATGLRDTNPELAAATRAQMRAAKEYIRGLPEADQALADELFQKFKSIGTVEEIVDAADQTNDLVGGESAITRLEAMLDEFAANRDNLPLGFIAKFRETAIEVKRLGEEGRAAMRGNAPLLAYVNERNEPNLQRGMLAPRGAFALADPASVTNAVDLDGNPVTAIAPGRVQLLIRNFVAKLARAPKLTVVRNQADLRAKFPQVYARAVAARPQGDFDTAAAMGYAFGEGEVIIFTDRIATEQQLRFVLAHETLGHFGLRGIMPGAKFDALMEKLYTGESRIQRAVDAAMALNPKLSRAEAVEEYLSDYAAVLDTSVVARVWNAIKSFLNALGVRTGDEMTRYLLDQARRYARSKSGATFDGQAFASRLHAVESLGGTGRFSTPQSLRDVNTTAGLLRDSIGGLPMSIEEGWNYLKGQGVNSMVSWDAFKAKFLSLSNFRARQNPGLAALEELVDETRNISMSLKVSYNERLRIVLNRAIAGEVGGISDKQTDTINRMLYAGQRAAVAKTRALADLGNVPLFTMVDGKLTENADELSRLRAIGRRSPEEMRDGFEYDVTFDEAGATVTKKERFAGIEGLTEDSVEWKGYTKVRDAMDSIEMELLRARYEGSLQERDLAFRQIAATVPEGELSAAERGAMTTLAQTYGNLYLSNVTQDSTGRAVLDVDYQTYANDVLRTSNAALIGERSDRFDALRKLLTEDRVFMTKDDKVRRTLPAVMEPQMADDLIAQLQAFKSRMRLGEDRYVVQNKIKQVILSELASKDADKYTKRTIATGYTPILREGKFQMRVQAYIGDKIVRLQDSYREQLVYSQFDTAAEAMEATQKTNALFGGTEFEVMAYDQDAGTYRLQKVQLRAVPERALDAIAAPPELNLNEFIRGLRQFDITLTPAKMEDVIVALTRQNSNARNRLERAFTPGAKLDGVMATMRHIESRASTIAKVLMRPRLAELMDRSMESTNRLWNGDPAALKKLKDRAEALATNATATKEEIADAQRAYEQYAYMYNQTNPSDGTPSRGNQFYNEAAGMVAFLDGNRNVDESDFGSGPLVSRIRAATSMMQLGGSVATGALNLLSLVTNGVPYLSSYNSKTAFGGGFSVGSVLSELSIAGKQVGAPGVTSRAANTAEFYDRVAAAVAADPTLERKYGLKAREAAFIAQEIRDGAMIPAQSNALVGSARGRTTSGFMQKFQDGWMWTFNVTEQASRRTLGLAAYRLEFARKTATGMGEAEADAAARAFAVKALQYTMGEYSVLNRPPAWRSGIQSFMYMYKVFPTTSVQMFANLSRGGKVGMIAGIVLLSGIAGLPFAEDLEDLADTLAQRLKIPGWQGARYETAKFIDSILPGMSTELLKGFVNEYVPADIAGRTSLGDLLPGTDVLLAGADPARALGEIFGPAPSMLLGSAKFAADVIAAPFSTTTSAEDVAREAPITMLRALGDTYAYLQNGAIVDRRGYVVSDQMTTGTVVARALGFYPSEAAQQYEMIRAAKRMTDYQREVSTGFRTAWIKAMMRGDTERARVVEETVADWNAGAKGTALEVRDFRKNAQRALKEARRPAIERTLRSAPDAAERDLQRMVDLLTAN